MGWGRSRRRSVSTVSSTAATASNGARDRPVSPSPRTEARIEIDETVEAGELILGGEPPLLGGQVRSGHRPVGLATGARAGRLGQQVDVHADHRQRRPQLVGHHAQELGPRRVERGQLDEAALDLGRQPALLDDAGQEGGDRLEEVGLVLGEGADVAGLDVEHADHLVVPDEGHREHARERFDVEAADPREPFVDSHVRDRDRRLRRRDPPGDALAPGQADLADLRAVEPVRRREGQACPLVIREVEGADLHPHRRRGPIDDRMHELVPVPRQRRQLGDVVEEGELAQVALGRRGRTLGRRGRRLGRRPLGTLTRHRGTFRGGCVLGHGPEGTAPRSRWTLVGDEAPMHQPRGPPTTHRRPPTADAERRPPTPSHG